MTQSLLDQKEVLDLFKTAAVVVEAEGAGLPAQSVEAAVEDAESQARRTAVTPTPSEQERRASPRKSAHVQRSLRPANSPIEQLNLGMFVCNPNKEPEYSFMQAYTLILKEREQNIEHARKRAMGDRDRDRTKKNPTVCASSSDHGASSDSQDNNDLRPHSKRPTHRRNRSNGGRAPSLGARGGGDQDPDQQVPVPARPKEVRQ